MAQSITFNRSTREIRRQNLKRQSEHQTFQFQSLTWGALDRLYSMAYSPSSCPSLVVSTGGLLEAEHPGTVISTVLADCP